MSSFARRPSYSYAVYGNLIVAFLAFLDERRGDSSSLPFYFSFGMTLVFCDIFSNFVERHNLRNPASPVRLWMQYLCFAAFLSLIGTSKYFLAPNTFGTFYFFVIGALEAASGAYYYVKDRSRIEHKFYERAPKIDGRATSGESEQKLVDCHDCTTGVTMYKTIGDIHIAGSLTTDDWKAFCPSLAVGGDPTPWKRAAEDYFDTRLRLRYLDPIKVLQENGTYQGEGFSIAAVQCSMVEFLESTVQGKSYRFVRKGDPQLGTYEYSSSGEIFVSFLVNREPFKNDFDEARARDFYVGVRCGLLHEARTKNGWTIWAKDIGARTIDANNKILYRDNFQAALLTFVTWYKNALPSETALQQAFIRKFNSLCL